MKIKMRKKRCDHCKKLKSRQKDFSKGQSRCKVCQAEFHKRWRKENREQHLEQGKNYYRENRDAILEKKKGEGNYWKDAYKNNRKKSIAIVRKYQKKYPERKAAHSLASSALNSGRIIKKRCEVCGSKKAEMHHDDYMKPLEVRWLCRKHHKYFHRKEFQTKKGGFIY